MHVYKVYIATHLHRHQECIARELKKVSVGRVKDERRTWFPELADKSKWIMYIHVPCVHTATCDAFASPFCFHFREEHKTHLYWCMKNAHGDPAELRRLTLAPYKT